MNKRPLFLLMSAVVLIGFGAGCKKSATNDNANTSTTNDIVNEEFDINALFGNDNENANLNTNVAVNTNTTVNSNVNSSTNTNTSTNTNLNTNTSTGDDETSTSSITITSPIADSELTSPFTVEGTATGSKVFVRLRSSGGTAIFTEEVSVKNGKYKGKLLFDFSSTKSGSIEVFQKDSSDQEVNLTSVKVTFVLSSSANVNSDDTE